MAGGDELMGSRWQATVAASLRFTPAELEAMPLGEPAETVLTALRDRLASLGAVPLGNVDLRLVESHALRCRKQAVGIVAEVEALLLLHPNPLPRMDPFPRPVLGFRRWWRRAVWSWRGERVSIEVRPDAVNLPRLSGGWVNEDEAFLALSWGTRGSDPVWLVSVVFKPRRLRRLVDWASGD